MAVAWRPVNHLTYQSPVKDGEKSRLTSGSTYNGLSVSSFYFKLDAMLELGFEAMAHFKSEADVAFFMLEVACYTDEFVVQDVTANQTTLERYGIGFRIGIANYKVAFSAASTLAAVAANAELSLSQTGIEVHAKGSTPEIQRILAPIFELTAFNTEALKKISGCATLLADYYAAHAEELTPALLQIADLPVGMGKDVVPDYWFNRFYSNQFAVESIYRGKTVNAALSQVAEIPDMNQYVVPSFVNAGYASQGITDPYTAPNATQKTIAGQMLGAGRY